MKRKAVINADNIVENVILADDKFSLKGKTIVDGDEVVMGMIYQEDGTFITPEKQIVEPVLTPAEKNALEIADLKQQFIELKDAINQSIIKVSK